MTQLFNDPQPINPQRQLQIGVENNTPYPITERDRIIQFQEQEYLFVLPGRTASRTIYQLLIDLNLVSVPTKNWIPSHAPVTDEFTGNLVVSVRHPLDRFISGYFNAMELDENLTLHGMIESIGIEGAQVFNGVYWTPNNIIYNSIGGRSADYIIHTETIEKDLLLLPFIDDVSKLEHIGKTGTTAERNAIINQIIFDRALADKINSVFEDDFVQFGYEFI